MVNLNYNLVSEAAAKSVTMPEYTNIVSHFYSKAELLESENRFNNKIREIKLALYEVSMIDEAVLLEGDIVDKIVGFIKGIIEALINLIKDIFRTIISFIKALLNAITGGAFKDNSTDPEYDKILEKALTDKSYTMDLPELVPTNEVLDSSIPMNPTDLNGPIVGLISELRTIDDIQYYVDTFGTTFDSLKAGISTNLFGRKDINSDQFKLTAQEYNVKMFGRAETAPTRLTMNLYQVALNNRKLDYTDLKKKMQSIEKDASQSFNGLIKELKAIKDQFSNNTAGYSAYKTKEETERMEAINKFRSCIEAVTMYTSQVEICYRDILGYKIKRLDQLFGDKGASAAVIKKCDEIVKAAKKKSTVNTNESVDIFDTEEFLYEMELFTEGYNELMFNYRLREILNEAEGGSFWEKIKAFFKNIIEKIKGLFNKAGQTAQQAMESADAQWWAENRVEIMGDNNPNNSSPIDQASRHGLNLKYSECTISDFNLYRTNLFSQNGQKTQWFESISFDKDELQKEGDSIKNNIDQYCNDNKVAENKNTDFVQEELDKHINAAFKEYYKPNPNDNNQAIKNIFLLKKYGNDETVTAGTNMPEGNGTILQHIGNYLDNYYGGKSILAQSTYYKKNLEELEKIFEAVITDIQNKIMEEQRKIADEKVAAKNNAEQQSNDQQTQNPENNGQNGQQQGQQNNQQTTGQIASFSLADSLGIGGSSILYQAMNELKTGLSQSQENDIKNTKVAIQGSGDNGQITNDDRAAASEATETLKKYQEATDYFNKKSNAKIKALSKIATAHFNAAQTAYNEYLQIVKSLYNTVHGAMNQRDEEITKAREEAEKNTKDANGSAAETVDNANGKDKKTNKK